MSNHNVRVFASFSGSGNRELELQRAVEEEDTAIHHRRNRIENANNNREDDGASGRDRGYGGANRPGYSNDEVEENMWLLMGINLIINLALGLPELPSSFKDESFFSLKVFLSAEQYSIQVWLQSACNFLSASSILLMVIVAMQLYVRFDLPHSRPAANNGLVTLLRVSRHLCGYSALIRMLVLYYTMPFILMMIFTIVTIIFLADPPIKGLI